MRMMRSAAAIILLISTLLLFGGCGPNKRILESSREEAASAPDTNVRPVERSFEADLESMRTADFYFIYVIRRKDGGVIGPDDKRFLAANLADANRRELSDGGKALIVGTNFLLPEEMLNALKGRFDVTDHSKPTSEIPPEVLKPRSLDTNINAPINDR